LRRHVGVGLGSLIVQLAQASESHSRKDVARGNGVDPGARRICGLFIEGDKGKNQTCNVRSRVPLPSRRLVFLCPCARELRVNATCINLSQEPQTNLADPSGRAFVFIRTFRSFPHQREDRKPCSFGISVRVGSGLQDVRLRTFRRAPCRDEPGSRAKLAELEVALEQSEARGSGANMVALNSNEF
jgi:hypothetical protein